MILGITNNSSTFAGPTPDPALSLTFNFAPEPALSFVFGDATVFALSAIIVHITFIVINSNISFYYRKMITIEDFTSSKIYIKAII